MVLSHAICFLIAKDIAQNLQLLNILKITKEVVKLNVNGFCQNPARIKVK